MTEIESLLPHRPPFLFVDRVESADAERIVAYRTFRVQTDRFFDGHFPGYPIVPGVVLVETMAQCGGAGLRSAGLLPGEALFFLATVENAKFRRQVRPDDQVRIEVENLRVTPRSMRQRGKAFVGDELAAEAEWMCLVGNKESLAKA